MNEAAGQHGMVAGNRHPTRAKFFFSPLIWRLAVVTRVKTLFHYQKNASVSVIPAQAGIQEREHANLGNSLDSRVRGKDAEGYGILSGICAKGSGLIVASVLFLALLAPAVHGAGSSGPAISKPRPGRDGDAVVRCANLIYAGSKSSKCFSDKFLSTTRVETNIETQSSFDPIKLAKEELFEYPFSVMTGEGLFTLLEEERINLRSYLERGGFLLASAGCSSKEWDQSFRRELKKVFPDRALAAIPMEHKIFKTVFDVTSVRLKKSSGSATLEGLEIDGHIVLIYSPEGLNDTANAGGGCCCCGGNEIRNSQEINVNVLTYALTH